MLFRSSSVYVSFTSASVLFICTTELLYIYRVKGTVIGAIWWQVLVVIVYTTGVVCVHNYAIEIKFPLTLVSVMGVVTGLLLVFRTNTAYDRYWEGRKLWSQMTQNIRNLSRCIWVLVEEKEGTTAEVIEKISAINLLVGFAYATRNYLREDYSYDEKDLREFINHLPKFSTPSSNQTLENQEYIYQPMCTRQRIQSTSVGTIKIKAEQIGQFHPGSRNASDKTYNIKAFETPVPTNVPIELSYYIASYINSVRKRELADSYALSLMYTALNGLVECLGGFERILRTPIPLAYSIHLHHATWLYILALPYQLTGVLDWFTIPTVGIAAFALFGILGIGWEIENPFGYDDNDLPLDDFCLVLHKEILTTIGHRMPTPDSWLLSELNHPLLPESGLTAAKLIEMEEPDVRKILHKGTAIRLSQRKPSILKVPKEDTPVVVVSSNGDVEKGEEEK